MNKKSFQCNHGVPQLSALLTKTLTSTTTADVTIRPSRVSVSLDTPASSVRVSEFHINWRILGWGSVGNACYSFWTIFFIFMFIFFKI